MRDELKRYTDQYRKEFDVYSLDVDEAWKSIEIQLDNTSKKGINLPWKSILKVAAVLFMMITVSFGYYLNNQRIDINRYGISLQDLSSELADTEAFYASQIDEKLIMIKVAKGSIDSDLLTQIEIFDADYQSLKNDLKDNADSEEVINAMIEHFRLKLSMLEKILKEIEKDNYNNDYEEIQAI